MKLLFDDDWSQWNANVKADTWFYEPFLLLRKIAFASATIAISLPTIQAYVGTLIVIVSLLLSAWWRPFKAWWLNFYLCGGQMTAVFPLIADTSKSRSCLSYLLLRR